MSLDKLPEVSLGLAGFTVSGAGPDLLTTLLEEYRQVVAHEEPSLSTNLEPGLSPERIRNALGAIGLEAPEELIVWWSSQNGYRAGASHKPRWAQLSLDTAITRYGQLTGPRLVQPWASEWLPVAGLGGRSSLAVSCQSGSEPPLVRFIDYEFGATTAENSTRYQVVSLCTPVTWWLMGYRRGWYRKDADGKLDLEAIPYEWRATQLF